MKLLLILEILSFALCDSSYQNRIANNLYFHFQAEAAQGDQLVAQLVNKLMSKKNSMKTRNDWKLAKGLVNLARRNPRMSGRRGARRAYRRNM